MSDRHVTMARFDEDVPEATVVAECAYCRGEIFAGDEVYRIDDSVDIVHRQYCADVYAKERTYDRYGVIGADGAIE